MKKLLFLLAFVCGLVVLSMHGQESPMPFVKPQFFDNNGAPADGYKICSFAAGTSTPLATYTSSTGGSQNTNPVVLDSSGRANIWLGSNSYKLTMITPDSSSCTVSPSIIWSVDNVNNLWWTNQNFTVSGNWTFTGTLTSSGTFNSTGTATMKNVNAIRFADQYCSTPGNYDATCFSNAASGLTTGGLIIVGNHTYNFGSTTVTLSPAASNITFKGVCVGNLTSNCPQIIGTASPLIAVTGTNAATRTGNVYLENLVFSPAAFSAAQVCLTADHVTNLVQTNVQYENCGQGEDLNDIYGGLHFHNAYNNCGSGDTAATACVRVENRSNTAVRSEQIYWDSQSLFQGATHEGIAVYFGPFTSETGIRNSKLDFGSTNPTHRIVVWDKSWYGQLSHTSVAAGTISTATGVIVATGVGGNLSFNFNITDNPVISTSASVPAILVDYGKWGVIGQNTFTSPGANTSLVTLSANSLDNIVIGNTNSQSNDVITVDSGTHNTSCNHQNGIAGIYCGTVYGTTTLIAGKTDGTAGRVSAVTGNGSVTGYLEWRLPNATRLGVLGNSASNIALALENSALFTVTGGRSQFDSLGTGTNCTSSAAPAVCGSAAAGSVAIAAAATTVVVNTTAVTASSQIFLTNDSSLSTKLSVTCNTQSSLTLGTPRVTARTAATSFTITLEVAPTADPACISYLIVN
jgi:hypothetical protein